MASQSEIDDQLQLLNIHRSNLVRYLKQKASLGSDHTPPGVYNGIEEARKAIREIKNTLASWEVWVENQPIDTEADEISAKFEELEKRTLADIRLVKIKAFRQSLDLLFESGQIREKVLALSPKLSNELSETITNGLMDYAIKHSIYEWRDKRIKTLNDTQELMIKRSREWLLGEEGRSSFLACVSAWYKLLRSEVEDTVTPIFTEHDIPEIAFRLPASFGEIDFDINQATIDTRSVSGLELVTSLTKSLTIIGTLVVFMIGSFISSLATGFFFSLTTISASSGPVGWTIGGSTLLILGAAYVLAGDEIPKWVTEQYMKRDLPKKIRARISDAKINTELEKAKPQFKEKVAIEIEKNVGRHYVDKVVAEIRLAVKERTDRAIEYIK